MNRPVPDTVDCSTPAFIRPTSLLMFLDPICAEEASSGEAAYEEGMRVARRDMTEEASPSGERVFKRSRSEPSTGEEAAANGLPGNDYLPKSMS